MGYIKTEEAIEALYRYGFVTKETIEKNIREIPTIDIKNTHDKTENSSEKPNNCKESE